MVTTVIGIVLLISQKFVKVSRERNIINTRSVFKESVPHKYGYISTYSDAFEAVDQRDVDIEI